VIFGFGELEVQKSLFNCNRATSPVFCKKEVPNIIQRAEEGKLEERRIA
jgi:hypothetical protein